MLSICFFIYFVSPPVKNEGLVILMWSSWCSINEWVWSIKEQMCYVLIESLLNACGLRFSSGKVFAMAEHEDISDKG